MKLAVDEIRNSLSRVDPEGSEFYEANAEAYKQELDSLHAWIQGQVESVPAERRLLVTSHDSFQYFSVRYGFEVVARSSRSPRPRNPRPRNSVN